MGYCAGKLMQSFCWLQLFYKSNRTHFLRVYRSTKATRGVGKSLQITRLLPIENAVYCLKKHHICEKHHIEKLTACESLEFCDSPFSECCMFWEFFNLPHGGQLSWKREKKLPHDEVIFDFLGHTAGHVMFKKMRIGPFWPLPVLVNLRLGHHIHQV